jgi:hypothetical protein
MNPNNSKRVNAMKTTDRIDAKIAKLRTEIAEWEAVKRRMAELENEESNGQLGTPFGPEPTQKSQDLKEKTIPEAAKVILSERGNAITHFADVAKAAISRGYKGKKGSNAAKITKSFAQTLRRESKIFEAHGQGKFTLKP